VLIGLALTRLHAPSRDSDRVSQQRLLHPYSHNQGRVPRKLFSIELYDLTKLYDMFYVYSVFYPSTFQENSGMGTTH
jgi:hypothetical protein